MITSLKLENFKGFESFELSNMKSIVLLSGRNNSGKTTILESLFLFLGFRASESFIKLNNFRGISRSITSLIWESFFRNMDVNRPMAITTIDDGVETVLCYVADNDTTMHPDVLNRFVSAAKKNYSLKYSLVQGNYQEIGHFTIGGDGILRNNSVKNGKDAIEMKHAQFVNNMVVTDASINDWFGQVELSGKKDRIIETLKIIEPKITDVRSISIGGQPILYANISEKMLPLKLCGGGINRLLYIIAPIMENQNSVLLVDEIETGFHYSQYSKIWEVIAKISKENHCQIFVSTHSIECINGAVEGIKKAEMTTNFVYYRLDRNDEHTITNRFDYEMLSDAICAGMEVR